MAGNGDGGNSRKGAGALIVVIGAVANVVGIAGTITGWGGNTTSVILAAAPAGATTAVASSTTTIAAPAQTASSFVARLGEAIRTGDEKFLFARLHPAVIARYGNAACLDNVRKMKDASFRFVVTGPPAGPADYAFTSDNKTTIVSGVVAVPVTRTAGDGTSRISVHTVVVDGTYRFFTDCTHP